MTHHPDAPSGQPYSQPPWDPNRLPPPGGGDGGGGKKRNWLPIALIAAAVLAVVAIGVVLIVGHGDKNPAPKVALPTVTASPTPVSGPAAFMADVAKVGFGDKDTTDQTFLTVGNKTCEGFNDGISYGDQVSVYLESDAKPTQVQAETLIRSAVKNLCPEYKPMLP